jgi:4-azaleucine resistance transporter AzlC
MDTVSKKVTENNSGWFLYGLRNGIPICLGYFAVSFALGIAAKNAGMTAMQSGVMSAAMVASAGEFSAVGLIASGAGVIEMITTALIVNLRYFLMSCSLTQKLKPGANPVHRFLIAYGVTDEIFGLSSTVDGYLNPFYTYGITIISVAGWVAGTVLGVLTGSILPAWATNALGVAMYGMFLAIIIPPARKNAFIGVLVALSMAASWLFTEAPYLRRISPGFRVIILTVLLAGAAAWIRPVDDEDETENDEDDDALLKFEREGETGNE